jgi:hypothetical protein
MAARLVGAVQPLTETLALHPRAIARTMRADFNHELDAIKAGLSDDAVRRAWNAGRQAT